MFKPVSAKPSGVVHVHPTPCVSFYTQLVLWSRGSETVGASHPHPCSKKQAKCLKKKKKTKKPESDCHQRRSRLGREHRLQRRGKPVLGPWQVWSPMGFQVWLHLWDNNPSDSYSCQLRHQGIRGRGDVSPRSRQRVPYSKPRGQNYTSCTRVGRWGARAPGGAQAVGRAGDSLSKHWVLRSATEFLAPLGQAPNFP